MAEASAEKPTLTEKPDDMSFADWKKYRNAQNQNAAATTAKDTPAGRVLNRVEKPDHRNRHRNRITEYDPRNNMQMMPFPPLAPPFPFFQQGPPPPPWAYNDFADDFGQRNFYHNRSKFGQRDDFFIGGGGPPPHLPPHHLRNGRGGCNPFRGGHPPPGCMEPPPMMHPPPPPPHLNKFQPPDITAGPVRPNAKKKLAKKKAKQDQPQNAAASGEASGEGNTTIDQKSKGTVTMSRQAQLYIQATTNGGAGGWVPKPPPPPPLESTDSGLVLEEKQRMWKAYRQAMKPFKHRDFANAKRTIQRFGKRTDLDEKEQSRLQRAQEFVAAHKTMLSQKAALRQNPQAMTQPPPTLIEGTIVPSEPHHRAPAPPPPPPLPANHTHPAAGVMWVRQQDLSDNPTVQPVTPPAAVGAPPAATDPDRSDCVIDIPETTQKAEAIANPSGSSLSNSHQSAWHLRQELTKLESLVDMAEFTGS